MINIIPITCTLLAGISTLIGYFIIYIKNNHQENMINFSCSFSAGILLSLSCFQLLKEAFLLLEITNIMKIVIITILLNIGFILYYLINKLKIINQHNNLYRLGILSTLILIIHNIPEGIITYLTSKNNLLLGIKLSLGIAFHNIPEGIMIAIPIYYSTKSKKKAFTYTCISAFSETFGAILTALFLEQYITKIHLFIIFTLTASLMIKISIHELLKEAIQYSNNNITIISFLLGTLLLLITIMI